MEKARALLCSAVLVLAWTSTVNAGSLTPDQVRDSVAICYNSQLDVRELTGNNDGPQVEKYLAATGFKKGVPWCAAFVTWVLLNACSVDIPNPRSAWSPAWFPDTHTIYIRGRAKNAIPERGDVFGIWFQNMGRIAHVGFIDRWPDGEYAITVEGNTNSGGSREGDGVYRKRRVKSNIYKVSRWI